MMNQSAASNMANQDPQAPVQTSTLLRRLKRQMFLDAVQGSQNPETSARDIVRRFTGDSSDSFSADSKVSASLMGKGFGSPFDR